MMPPAPTRIVDVPPATCPINTAVAAPHDVHGRLLAALQRPEHLIDHAFVNQLLQALGGFHASDDFNNSWNTAHYG
jgi:hypothetical protein